jgi:hypothetical protein
MTREDFDLAVNCDIRHLMQAAEAREQQEESAREVNRLRDMADDELPGDGREKLNERNVHR